MQRQITITTPENKPSQITLDCSMQLGKGDYGKVYAGEIVATKEAIAVKLMNGLYVNIWNSSHPEVDIMKSLTGTQSKNIVQLVGYDFSDDHLTFTIAMTYAANGSLHDWLSGNKGSSLYPNQQLTIMRGAANGLAYMHDLNILHCDLKPANVLLDHNMEPMLCDFGISKRENIDNLYDVGGSALFLPPELLFALCCKPNQAHSKASDIYSFSLLCWCVVAQTAIPYERFNTIGDIEGLFNWVALLSEREVIPPEPQCPGQVAEVIKVGWQADPEKRPTANQLQNMLNDVEHIDAAAQTNLICEPYIDAISDGNNLFGSNECLTKIDELNFQSASNSSTIQSGYFNTYANFFADSKVAESHNLYLEECDISLGIAFV